LRTAANFGKFQRLRCFWGWPPVPRWLRRRCRKSTSARRNPSALLRSRSPPSQRRSPSRNLFAGADPVQLRQPSPNDPNGVKPPRPLESASTIYVSARKSARTPIRVPARRLKSPRSADHQHSGEGKANQYQLRGFQLDHGTDLAIWYDGMPLNMPTHGHGRVTPTPTS